MDWIQLYFSIKVIGSFVAGSLMVILLAIKLFTDWLD